MAAGLKPAYLITGDDGAKVDEALGRLRERAQREGGAAAIESFDPGPGSGPDVDALTAAIPAISLILGRRYLLAEGTERWRAAQVKRLAEALVDVPDDVTVVLVARGRPPAGLERAVEEAGGEALKYAAPGKRGLPSWLARAARERGFTLEAKAARALTARLGESTTRLATELDRIALWAEPGAEVGVGEVEELTADTSERAGWTLGDAIVARDVADAVAAADALLAQGEAVTPMVYGIASRLRNAHLAASALEAGRPAKEVEGELPLAPYPSRMLVRSVRGKSADELSEAIGVAAELEWWIRGGSTYSDEVALTLAVRAAAGAEPRP